MAVVPGDGLPYARILKGKVFTCRKQIIGWRYYRADSSSSVYATVWKQEGTDQSWSLVARTRLPRTTTGLHVVPQIIPIKVDTNYTIGLHYVSASSRSAFGSCSTELRATVTTDSSIPSNMSANSMTNLTRDSSTTYSMTTLSMATYNMTTDKTSTEITTSHNTSNDTTITDNTPTGATPTENTTNNTHIGDTSTSITSINNTPTGDTPIENITNDTYTGDTSTSIAPINITPTRDTPTGNTSTNTTCTGVELVETIYMSLFDGDFEISQPVNVSQWRSEKTAFPLEAIVTDIPEGEGESLLNTCYGQYSF